MADNINLLPQQSEENTQQKRQRKMVNQVSTIVLVIAIAIVVGLFSAKLVLDQQLNAIAADIQSNTQRIQAKKNEEGIQKSLIQRIHGLDAFFAQQNHYTKFLTEFNKTIPTSLSLTDMMVASDLKVTLTGNVASYADLAGFYAKLATSGAPAGSDVGTNFITPMLTTITRNEQTGQIEFGLTFNINPSLLRQAADSGEAE